MRFLLLFSPIFLLHPIACVFQASLFPDSSVFAFVPYVFFVFWCAVVPVLYGAAIFRAHFNRIVVEGGRMVIGANLRDAFAIEDLEEVTGHQGSAANNYEESILLRFADKREIKIPINDYEEVALRELITRMKEVNPQARYVYTDVLPLESRGLLKFLHGTTESDNMIIGQSKTPVEDTMYQLVKDHEKLFFVLYGLIWFLVMCGLTLYSAEVQAMHATASGSIANQLSLDTSNQLTDTLRSAELSGSTGLFHLAYIYFLKLNILLVASLIYFSNQGLEMLAVIWAFIGFVLAAVLPMIRKMSPNFVFIDSGSIGMGTRFFRWDEVATVALHKVGEFGDPLEGVLEIDQSIDELRPESLKIHLSRIADIGQRHRLLRLTERYGNHASFNEEFMRTTNVLVDIQFTDLWLEQADSSVKSLSLSEGGKSVGGGRYIVDSVLGYGGQGTTYLAHRSDEEVENVVVKEIILPSYADVRILQDAKSRFVRSARLLAGLEHEQIVRLLDYFVEEGKAYLILEYVEGKDLRRLVQEKGAFRKSEVIDMGLQLCRILDYLHDRNESIIHCDLAPDNLILTESGQLKLLDFDVAHVLDSRTTGFVAARPSYTPPEQFRGNPTAKSDLFSMGAILHYLSKGADPPPLGVGVVEDVESLLPSALSRLISSCCAFNESTRPSSAVEVESRLFALSNTDITEVFGKKKGSGGQADTRLERDTRSLVDTDNDTQSDRGLKIKIRKKELQAE